MATSVGVVRIPVEPEVDPAAAGKVRNDLGKLGEEASRALAEKGQLIAGLGDKLTLGLTAPLVGLGTVALKEFAQVEAGLAEVVSLTGEVGPAAAATLDEFAGGLSDLSSEIGLTQDNLVGGLYQALSAGVPRDNVFEFLETAGKAAIAGVSDTETAVDALSTIVNSYGSDVIDAGRAADIAFAAVKAGKTDFTQLAGSLANVLPVASSVGVSFEEVGAAIAQLTARGVPTAQATTQMRAALTELSAAGTEVSDTFTEVAGKSFRDFIADGGDMTGALEILGQAAADQGVNIADLFGSMEAGSAILGLAGSNLDAYTAQIENMTNSAGAAADAFSVIDESTSRKFERLSVAAKNVAIELGAALVPAVEAFLPLVQGAVGFVGRLADAFGNASPLIKDIIVGVTGFAVALVPILSIGGRLTVLFAQFGPTLAAAFSPVTIWIAGIAALGAALVIAWRNSETFRGIVRSALGAVANTFSAIVEKVQTFAQAVRDGFEFGTTLGEDIGGIIGIGEKLGGLIGVLVFGFQNLGSSADNFDAVSGAVLRFGQITRRVFDAVLSAVQTTWTLLSGIDWGDVFSTVGSAVSTAFGAISSAVSTVVGVLSRVDWARIFGALSDAARTAGSVLIGVFQAIAGAVAGVVGFLARVDWGGIFDGVSGVVRGVVNFLARIDWGGIFDGLSTVVREVVDVFRDAWPKVSDSISGVVTILTQFGKLAFYIVRETGQAFGDLAGIIGTAMGAVVKVFEALWPVIRVALAPIALAVLAVVTAIQTVWDRFGDHIIDAVSTAWNLVSGIISAALSTIQGVINIFAGLLTGDWSRLWDGLTQVVSGVWQAITTVISTGWQSIQLAINVGITAVRALWDGAWAALSAVVSTVWSTISGAVTGGLTWITEQISLHISAIRSVWDAGWAAITTAVSAAWAAVTSTVSGAWAAVTAAVSTGVSAVVGFVAAMPGQILAALGALPGLLVGLASSMIQTFLSTVQSTWTSVTGWLSTVPGLIVSALGSLATTLAGAGRDLIVGLRTAAVDAFGGVVSFVAGIPGRIVGAVGDLSRVLYQAGKDLIGGLVKGIGDAVGGAIDAAKGMVGSVVGAVTSGFGIFSPSRVFAELGRQLPPGLAVGIDKATGIAVSATEDMASAVADVPIVAPDFADPFRAAIARNFGVGAAANITPVAPTGGVGAAGDPVIAGLLAKMAENPRGEPTKLEIVQNNNGVWGLDEATTRQAADQIASVLGDVLASRGGML